MNEIFSTIALVVVVVVKGKDWTKKNTERINNKNNKKRAVAVMLYSIAQ